MEFELRAEYKLKYGITFDEQDWPVIENAEDYTRISYDAGMRLLLLRTQWLKNRIDGMEGLV